MWADSISTTSCKAGRFLSPEKVSEINFFCCFLLLGCFRTFEKRWVIRCAIRTWDCCITLFGILSGPSAQANPFDRAGFATLFYSFRWRALCIVSGSVSFRLMTSFEVLRKTLTVSWRNLVTWWLLWRLERPTRFQKSGYHFAIEAQGLLFCKIVSWKLSALRVDLSKLDPWTRLKV